MMTFVILKICSIIGKTNICFDWIGKSDHLIEKGIELLVYVQFDHLFFKDPKNLLLAI